MPVSPRPPALVRGARRWLRALLLGGVLAAPAAFGQAPVHVVLSQTTPPYLQFVRALEQALGELAMPATVETHSLHAYSAAGGLPEGIWLSVGTEALRALGAAPPPGPVLFTLVPRETLHQAVRRPDWRLDPERFSAIYIDQPLPRHVALIRAVLPDARQVFALPAERTTGAALWEAAARAGLSVQAEPLGDPGGLVPMLTRFLPEADAVLALPDPHLLSGRGVQNLLLATYRHRVPVFAYSEAYVRAGATFSVFSTPQQIGRQAAEVIAAYLDAEPARLPGPMYPRDFEIAVNPRVAHSLGLSPADVGTLKAYILSFEAKQIDE